MRQRPFVLKFMPFMLVALLLLGCNASHTSQEESSLSHNNISPEDLPTETILTAPTEAPTTIPTETQPRLIGKWTLERCKDTNGIFIAHEDGSFTKLNGGGYLYQENWNDEGMFMPNDLVKKSPTISKSDKVVLFCDTDFTLRMLPVYWDAGVISTTASDGTRGYTRVIKYEVVENECFLNFFTYYENHQREETPILYIDGIHVDDYDFEFVYEGGKREKEEYGFPRDTTVKLGIQAGSSVTERVAEVNATFFNCDVKTDNYGASDDLHYLYPTPTVDGYAVVDIYDGWHDAEIPSGTYVMVFEMGKRYIAYLVEWSNS